MKLDKDIERGILITCSLAVIIAMAIGFGFGYWIGSHY
jgi:hypothetical protein